MFDGPRATLTYFKDGLCLGPAFTDIDTRQTLYPAVCSTGMQPDSFSSSSSSYSSSSSPHRELFPLLMATMIHNNTAIEMPFGLFYMGVQVGATWQPSVCGGDAVLCEISLTTFFALGLMRITILETSGYATWFTAWGATASLIMTSLMTS